MVCIYCGGETSVENSRWQKRNNQVWRRRACKACGAVFTSHEAIDLSSTLSVQNGPSMEPFVTERLYASILDCMQHRPNRYIDSKETVFTVTRRLTKGNNTAVIGLDKISDQTAKVLKALDRKAYLHYTANQL